MFSPKYRELQHTANSAIQSGEASQAPAEVSRASRRLKVTSAVEYRGGSVLTQSVFDSGVLDSQPFILNDGFGYKEKRQNQRC
jgi:hypothetical protein